MIIFEVSIFRAVGAVLKIDSSLKPNDDHQVRLTRSLVHTLVSCDTQCKVYSVDLHIISYAINAIKTHNLLAHQIEC